MIFLEKYDFTSNWNHMQPKKKSNALNVNTSVLE